MHYRCRVKCNEECSAWKRVSGFRMVRTHVSSQRPRALQRTSTKRPQDRVSCTILFRYSGLDPLSRTLRRSYTHILCTYMLCWHPLEEMNDNTELALFIDTLRWVLFKLYTARVEPHRALRRSRWHPPPVTKKGIYERSSIYKTLIGLVGYGVKLSCAIPSTKYTTM